MKRLSVFHRRWLRIVLGWCLIATPCLPTAPVLAEGEKHIPEIEQFTVPSTAEVGQSVAIRITAADADGDPVSCNVDFGNGATTGATTTDACETMYAYPEPGTFMITATVTDGKDGSTSMQYVTIGQPADQPPSSPPSNQPLQVTLMPDPPSGKAPLTVSFKAEVSGSDSYSYNFASDDGATHTGRDASVQHTFFSAGDHTTRVTVVADGNRGEAVAEATVHVDPVNRPPIANAGPDQTVQAGSVVTVDGSASTDPDGDQLICAIEQIGGRSVKLKQHPNCSASFTAPNFAETLHFTVRVSDGKETSDDQKMVTVLSDQSPSNPPEPADLVISGRVTQDVLGGSEEAVASHWVKLERLVRGNGNSPEDWEFVTATPTKALGLYYFTVSRYQADGVTRERYRVTADATPPADPPKGFLYQLEPKHQDVTAESGSVDRNFVFRLYAIGDVPAPDYHAQPDPEPEDPPPAPDPAPDEPPTNGLEAFLQANPTSARVGEVVTFTGRGSTPQVPFQLDYGDGTRGLTGTDAASLHVSHSYASARREPYTATLMLVHPGGQRASASIEVEIGPAPLDSPPENPPPAPVPEPLPAPDAPPSAPEPPPAADEPPETPYQVQVYAEFRCVNGRGMAHLRATVSPSDPRVTVDFYHQDVVFVGSADAPRYELDLPIGPGNVGIFTARTRGGNRPAGVSNVVTIVGQTCDTDTMSISGVVWRDVFTRDETGHVIRCPRTLFSGMPIEVRNDRGQFVARVSAGPNGGFGWPDGFYQIGNLPRKYADGTLITYTVSVDRAFLGLSCSVEAVDAAGQSLDPRVTEHQLTTGPVPGTGMQPGENGSTDKNFRIECFQAYDPQHPGCPQETPTRGAQ